MRPVISSPHLPAASYDFVNRSAAAARPVQSGASPTMLSSAKPIAKGHHALLQLQNDLAAGAALNNIIRRHLNSVVAAANHESRHAGELGETQLLRASISELMEHESISQSGNPHLQVACRDVISMLDLTVSRLRLLGADREADDYDREYYCSPDLHESGLFEELKKRFLGTSDLDEAPHAVVGAKAGISEIVNREPTGDVFGSIGTQGTSSKENPAAGSDDFAARLKDFQMHSVPQSAGELATDMALSGVLGMAGLMAASAGRGERIEANDEKREATDLKRVLEEERNLLQGLLNDTLTQIPIAFSHDYLRRELLIVNSQLESVEYSLAHVGKKKQVGVGSELAGWQMILKSVIDSVCKPLAFSGAGGAQVAEAAASVSGFATAALSPGAAISGLWMGVNAKRFFKAEREEWKALLDTAVRQSGLQPEKMPEEIRQDFSRVFQEGKWKSHMERLLSINRLLNWFVGGMSGYTGAMTGISIHNMVQLALAGSIIAELSMSGGIVTATGFVLIGTLAFLKHHAKFHDYEHWLEAGHPVVDLDLFREIAANGGADIGRHAVDTLRFYESKENRRQTFLHDIAKLHGLNYDGFKLHSTDSEEVKAERRRQMDESQRNASQHFLDIAARGRKSASFVGHSAEQLVRPGAWRRAFKKAREDVHEAAMENSNASGHRHARHDAHMHGGAGRLKTGLNAVAAPVRNGARIAAATIGNTLEPASRKAKQTYADRTDRLTMTKLQELLLSPASAGLVRGYMQDEAEAHAQFAQTRLQTAMKGYSSELTHTDEGVELPAGLKDRFKKKGLRLARDQAHVKQASDFLAGIGTVEVSGKPIEPGMLAGILRLHNWSGPPAQAAQVQDEAHELAKYLWKGAHEDFRKARLCLTAGVLKLAPLLESAKANQAAGTASTNMQSDAQSSHSQIDAAVGSGWGIHVDESTGLPQIIDQPSHFERADWAS